MSDREGHFQAAGFAGLKVEEFQAALASTLAIGEEALSAIANAIGDTNIESGMNARNFIAEAIDRVTEQVGVCESAKAELLRYGSGF